MPRIVTLSLLVLLLASAGHAAPNQVKRKPSTVRTLKGRLNGLRDRRSMLKVTLVKTRSQTKAVKKTLVVVDNRLQSVQKGLLDTRRRLVAARRSQTEAANRAEEASRDLENARLRARQRLRALGKGGTANVLAAFVTSGSVGDLTSRQDAMARIARRDHEIFVRVKETRRVLTLRKEERDASVSHVKVLERRERDQQSRLRVYRAQKGQQLVGLGREAERLESRLRQFDADEREIQRLIALANRPRPRRPGYPSRSTLIGRFLRPVNGPITSGFGMRFHPILHRSRLHAGVDFGAPIGTPVHAAGPGVVVAATRMSGFGNVIILDHGGGISTVYAHLSRIGVRSGAKVSRGRTIGAVGMTGLATGPHLHWEVHVGARAINPMTRL